jgi:hypothetical protein
MFYVNEQLGLILVACSLSVAGVFLTFLFKLLQKIPIIEKDVNDLKGHTAMLDMNFNQHKNETSFRHDTLQEKVRELGDDLRDEISANANKHEERLNQLRLELKHDIQQLSGKIDTASDGIFKVLNLISKKD